MLAAKMDHQVGDRSQGKKLASLSDVFLLPKGNDVHRLFFYSELASVKRASQDWIVDW